MDLRQLEVIRAIAETGSFTAAGHKLHVSQSAISRQILLLEEELGEAVFHRVGRRVRITPAGESPSCSSATACSRICRTRWPPSATRRNRCAAPSGSSAA